MDTPQKQLAALFDADQSDLPTMRKMALQATADAPLLHASVEAAIDLYAANPADGRFAFDAIDWPMEVAAGEQQ